jgi:hypothetical protein
VRLGVDMIDDSTNQYHTWGWIAAVDEVTLLGLCSGIMNFFVKYDVYDKDHVGRPFHRPKIESKLMILLCLFSPIRLTNHSRAPMPNKPSLTPRLTIHII